jgi:predicted nucleic acid-binding Zn ribbon protein
MEGMRELLRANLRRSLQAMTEIDRLAAAWPVVCGAAMAAHGKVVGYEDGIVSLEISDETWTRQVMSMQGQIGGELGRIAGVRVTGVHFERKGTSFRGKESRG